MQLRHEDTLCGLSQQPGSLSVAQDRISAQSKNSRAILTHLLSLCFHRATTVIKFVEGANSLAFCSVERVDQNVNFWLEDKRVLLGRAVKIVHVVAHKPGVCCSKRRQIGIVQGIMKNTHRQNLLLGSPEGYPAKA